MEKVNAILNILKDGEWHSLEDIAETSFLRNDQVKAVMDFLAEYDFIILSKERLEAKISASMLRFLNAIQKVEENENLAKQIG